jgi:ATP-dependent helicase/nuclease subunit B
MAMSGRLEVVGGSAGSGKTAGLLELFRSEQSRLLQACSPGGAVWISPTNRSRREIARHLLNASLRACLAPNVLTFDSFAERLLHTSGSQIVPLSPVARRMIARTVIDSARSAGALAYFAPIAHTSGFLDLFLGFVSELKRDETWPDQFEQACRNRGWVPRDADLSLLYGRYQDRLNDLSLYDAEGKFWSARTALAEGRRGAFDPLSLVIVDGFADFTQPQYEILQHLSEFADRVIVSLPLENPRVRTDLFAKSSQASDEIKRSGRASVTWMQPPPAPPDGVAASFRHIASHLFDNPRDVPPLASAEGIEIVEAAGPAGEARAVAERIRALLLDGVAADQIIVGMRGVDDESDILRGTLSAAGIPNGSPARIPLSRMPLARTLLTALQTELDDWPFDGLCALLRSNHFRPGWLTTQDTRGVDATIRLLRKRKLGSERRRILWRLAKNSEDAKSPVDRADSALALGLLSDLSSVCDRLRTPATFPVWIDRIVSLCDDLGIAPPERRNSDAGAPTETVLDNRDQDHWTRLKEVLYEAAHTISLLEEVSEFGLDISIPRLKDILESQDFGAEKVQVGHVLVLDASDVRNLDVPHLFLTGLSEASFPRSRHDDCLYTDAERRRHVRKGPTNEVASSPHQDEMLLFYSIVTRARRSLTLSYPSVSTAGQPLFSSPYVAAARSLFAPEALRVTSYDDLDPVPRRERTLTGADLRLVATEDVRSERPALFRLLAERTNSAPTARCVLASSEMAAARFEQSGFSEYEGLLRRPANVDRIATRFHRDFQFSATQLQGYAACPFRFLLSQVLNIEPQESVEAEIDPRGRGLVLHRILKQLHNPAPESRRTSEMPDGPQIGRLLLDLAAESFLPPEECTPFERAVLTVERRFAELFAGWYADQWDTYRDSLGENWDNPLTPRFVELPFGDVRVREDGPHPHAQPFATFGTGADQVRVQGQIDRVDVGKRGTTTAFAVIDYKTRSGERFGLKEVRAGLALQLAIYVSAIRQSKLLGPEPGLFQMLFWNLTRNGCVQALKGSHAKRWEPVDPVVVAEIEQSLHKLLPQMAARIRGGEFPVRNADLNCTGYCPYNTVCRVNQVRSIERERHKIWDLSLP